ncbi:unnamed protein product [Cunninghamella blakesleeana]
MLRVTSVLQLQSIWEKPMHPSNESNATKLIKPTTSLSEIANEVLTTQMETEVTSMAIADADTDTSHHKKDAGPAIFVVHSSDSEILKDDASSILHTDAASSASENVVQPPTLQISNPVHSDRGNSIPNMETVENENSLHASPSTHVPMIQVISLNDDLLNNKPLPKTPTLLKINTSTTTTTTTTTTNNNDNNNNNTITTTTTTNNTNNDQIITSSKTPSLKSSSSTSSSITESTPNHPNDDNINNKNDLILQGTTSSISSTSTSSSKKLNIPLTPKEDSSSEEDDQGKKTKRKSSFHFKRYSFLNKPNATSTTSSSMMDSNISPPPSLHSSSFHLPPSPSSMFNGANQALKRESSKLNLRRKSLSKKVKKAISNIKLNNNATPSPVA